jgi:hypothetical protein
MNVEIDDSLVTITGLLEEPYLMQDYEMEQLLEAYEAAVREKEIKDCVHEVEVPGFAPYCKACGLYLPDFVKAGR